MILIINTCKQNLSEFEYVRPLALMIENHNIKRITQITKEDMKAEKIIITGTALKDFDYLDANVDWIKDYQKPILGICAGAQLIAKAFNLKIEDKTIIGVQKATAKENRLTKETFNAYFVTTKTIKGETIAETDRTPCMIKIPDKEIYALTFHPEVMNPEIIENFLKI